jgi:integrase
MRGDAAPPPGTKILKPAVDLEAMIPAYLGEKKRGIEAQQQITSTLQRFLACAEKAGLPADSRQASAAFKAELRAKGLKPQSVNFNLGKVSAFLKWCVAHGYCDSNPAGALKMPADDDAVEKLEPYSRAEVQGFLDRLCLDPTGPHFEPRHWYLALLIATGARSNEIASLRLVDVQRTPAGIVYVDIAKDGNRKVKNKMSIRQTPIIDALAEPLFEHVAGMVAAGEQLLFPFWTAARPGHSAGHWARPWLGGKVHRLRHSVATGLRDSGVVETVAAECLGHSKGTTMSFGLYAGRSPLATLKDALEKAATLYRWPVAAGQNVPANIGEPA